MQVKVLTGVLDPPPSALAVPWWYLMLTLAVAAASIITAGAVAVRNSRRAPVEVLRSL